MGKDLKGKELGSGISQRKDGRYCARYNDRFGKRAYLYSRNLTELKKELNKAIYEDANQKNIIDKNITLDSWFDKWINIYKFNTIRANTKRYYEHVYHKHISNVLGKRKITEIRHIEIVAIIKDLYKRGYGYETQNKVRIILLDMFNKAMVDELVIKNPAQGLRVRKDKVEVRVLSKEEQTEFFECARGTFYNNLFQVAISTGLRQGELCALTWDDIDLDKKEIHVTKTLLYQKLGNDEQKTFHIELPKTLSSVRSVPINRQCEIALKKQRIQQNVIMGKRSAKPIEGFKNLLFTTKYGTPINAQIYNEAIKSIINEINLCRDEADKFETFSSHTFRHSFATRCFESGIHPKTVQKYLGHATLSMTMDLYTHVLGEHKQEEMEKLDIDFTTPFSLEESIIDKQLERVN